MTAELTIDAGRLWVGEAPWQAPLAFVDLDRTTDWPDDLQLPAFPVIGLGEPGHPLAARLDAVVEPPFTADALARSVMANPRATAVLTSLLRMLPALDAEQGLVAESFAYGLLQGSEEHGRWLAGNGSSHAAAADRSVDCTQQGGHLIITMQAEQIDRTMRDALAEAFAVGALDPTIHTVSLQAQGRTFSLGADLAEFGTTRDPATAHAIRMQTLPALGLMRCADRLEVHVQGACVGAGLEMAAWARRLTATPNAWFQLPELAMGILPGAGGCVALTRRLGRQRTALLILSGKRIGARQALGLGLVDAIVDEPPGDPGGEDGFSG